MMKMQSFVIWIETYKLFHCSLKSGNIYKDVAKDFEARFDISNYEIGRPSLKEEKIKGNWINERLIRWRNHERICCIKGKDIQLFKRQQGGR